jgi:hypothetical protein
VLAVGSAIRRITQGFAFGVVRNAITDTPVDTGKARANWQGSLGSPRTSERATLGRSPAPAIGLARSVIRFMKNGDTFYLTNNADYIEDLNRGKSRQQPTPGYVERAVFKGIQEGARTPFVIE